MSRADHVVVRSYIVLETFIFFLAIMAQAQSPCAVPAFAEVGFDGARAV